MKTLNGLLKEGIAVLEASGNGEARLDAWLLLEYVTEITRAYFYAHMEEAVSEEISNRYLDLCRKRAEHIPLQHLTNQAFFMGYEFYVNEHVLIPRQDTEVLVEEAEKRLKDMEQMTGAKQLKVLDMCTGSGCILLSVLADLENMCGVGVDISKEALKVAEKNAGNLQVQERVQFIESNLFFGEFFSEKDGKEPEKYDMLMSNPPYIPTAEIEELMEEVRFHDPRLALDGHEDGLYFYRIITEEAKEYLKPGGWLLYEIGCSQGEDVSALMREAGFENIAVVKDLPGLDRVVLGQRPH